MMESKHFNSTFLCNIFEMNAVLRTIQTPRLSSLSGEDFDLQSSGTIHLTTDGADLGLEVSSDTDVTFANANSKSLQVTTDNVLIEATKQTVRGDVLSSVKCEDDTSSTIVSGSTLEARAGSADDVAYVSSKTTEFGLYTGDASTSIEGGAASMRSTHYHDISVDGATVISIDESTVTISPDVHVLGTVNNISGTQTTLRIEDPNISIATSTKTDSSLSGSSGLSIDTTPSEVSNVTYMSGFKNTEGDPLFVTSDNTVNTEVASSSSIFQKHVLHDVSSGVKVLGKRTTASRGSEPNWTIHGGSMRLRKDVFMSPGSIMRYIMSMRVTDEGIFEVCRISIPCQHNPTTNEFVEGIPTTVVLQQCISA